MQSELLNQDQKTQQAQQVQQNTTNNLEDMLKIARETREIAANSAIKLDRQGEQLQHMKKQMNEIDGDMVKAKKTIRNMEFKWYDPRTWAEPQST